MVVSLLMGNRKEGDKKNACMQECVGVCVGLCVKQSLKLCSVFLSHILWMIHLVCFFYYYFLKSGK